MTLDANERIARRCCELRNCDFDRINAADPHYLGSEAGKHWDWFRACMEEWERNVKPHKRHCGCTRCTRCTGSADGRNNG